MAILRHKLTVVDRTTIEVRLQDGWGVRAIARSLSRSAGMRIPMIPATHSNLIAATIPI